MVEQYTAPIKHSGASAAAHTAAGAAKGGFMGFLKGVAAIAAVGAVIGLGISLLATGAVTLPAWVGPVALSGSTGNALIIAASTIVGAIGAAVFGGPFAGSIGAAIGGVKGGSKAHDRVREERGAAATVQAQIDMIRAQNPAAPATNIYVPTANNYTMAPGSFPEQGTKMNPALPVIQGSSVQYDGLAMNQQRAAAMV